MMPLRRQARLIAWILPRRLWYRAAVTICRLHGSFVALIGGNRVLTESVLLDHWLWELTAVGAFPIPWALKGQDVIEAADPKIGTVYCWIHEPLAEFPMRPSMDLGYPTPTVVADKGRIVEDGQYRVFGRSDRLTAIPADRYALGRAKRLLAEGTSVVCLADEYLGGPLLPYVMQIAGRVGARVVFQWARRRSDGTIDVTFVTAPRPYCEDEQAIHENLAFLKAAQQRALQSLGLLEKKLPEETNLKLKAV